MTIKTVLCSDLNKQKVVDMRQIDPESIRFPQKIKTLNPNIKYQKKTTVCKIEQILLLPNFKILFFCPTFARLIPGRSATCPQLLFSQITSKKLFL